MPSAYACLYVDKVCLLGCLPVRRLLARLLAINQWHILLEMHLLISLVSDVTSFRFEIDSRYHFFGRDLKFFLWNTLAVVSSI